MKILWVMLSVLIVGLNACQTLSGDDYDYPLFFEKSLDKQKLKNGEGLYRLKIDQPGDPTYLIKVKTLKNGKAVVQVQTTKRGYAIKKSHGGHVRDLNTSSIASRQETSEFLEVLEANKIWEQLSANIYEFGEVSTGPQFISLSARSEGRDISYDSFYPHIRKNTPNIALAFHDIAGFGKDDKWSFYQGLKAHTETEWSYAEE